LILCNIFFWMTSNNFDSVLPLLVILLFLVVLRQWYSGRKTLKKSANLFSGRKSTRQWKNRSILSIENISLEDIQFLMHRASEIKQRVLNEDTSLLTLAAHKILGCIFYEPSTRTCCSFQAAMSRLGGKVISITDVKSSSVSKGESLEDTIRCLSQYCDILCLRHPDQGTAKQAAMASEKDNVPIINAGDGSGEHPTQALLDLFTIFEFNEHHSIDHLTITFVGDMKYGRTVHSLVPALFKFKDVTINLVSPKLLAFPENLKQKLLSDHSNSDQNHNHLHEFENLTEEIIKNTDVMYVTRIQKERFAEVAMYEKYKGIYVIDNQLLEKCKKSMILMHPLPRVDEIATECDNNPRSKYFEQMKCGMYLRMALLALILDVL